MTKPNPMPLVEWLVRVMYDASPHTVISPAIAEATGLPDGAVLDIDTLRSHGGSVEGLERYARAILTAIEAAGCKIVQGWQPIETAPRDGAEFIGFGNNFGDPLGHAGVHFGICYFDDVDARWFRDSGESGGRMEYLTHWMPLPSAPGTAAAPKIEGRD